jgi:hypothetical protein
MRYPVSFIVSNLFLMHYLESILKILAVSFRGQGIRNGAHFIADRRRFGDISKKLPSTMGWKNTYDFNIGYNPLFGMKTKESTL